LDERRRKDEIKLAKLFHKLYPNGKPVLLWADGPSIVYRQFEGEEPLTILI
jgi:hypothetical protein